ncbi:MAG: hypothetical protein Q9191_000788 [Dirinaria sp. TL-2023a]
MVFVDMDSLQFYEPPAKSGVRSNGRSITSKLCIPSPRWEGVDYVAPGASQNSGGTPYDPNLIQSQNGTSPLQKDSLDSFRAPEIDINGVKADKEMASISNQHGVPSWDDIIPLCCQNPSDRPHHPRFHQPPEIICKTGVLSKPATGETTCDGHDSLDDFGSESRHEASSTTTSPRAMSSGVSSSNEGQMKNTVTGDKEAGGLVTAALNIREQPDSSWLDIGQFFNTDPEAENGAAESKCQETGNIEDQPGPDGIKDGQAGDGCQDMNHSVDGAEDGPRDADGVMDGGEDIIAGPGMKGLEVDGGRFPGKNCRRAGVGVDTEGEQDSSDTQALQALMASSLPLARRGRGRPRCSRPTIVVGTTCWEVTKVAGDEQSSKGRIFKVQAEAWLAEKDVSSLRDAIATYWGKQGRTRRKRKIICGGKRRSARGKREERQAST